MSLQIIILAAGQGKRMYSSKPKVLHSLGGIPMLQRVIQTAIALAPDNIHVIYGHKGDVIQNVLADMPVHWIYQAQQLGTGHAVLQALPHLPPKSQVLILSGDVPLISQETLDAVVSCANKSQTLTLLTALLPNPFGLGRIIRDHAGLIDAIVEEKDASDLQRQIKEVYTGICSVPTADLARWLPKLSNQNAQGEYYLTDMIHLAVQERQVIQSVLAEKHHEVLGVNNRLQLQQLERVWQQLQAENLMLSGVTLADAARIDIRGTLVCEADVFIDVNCLFHGQVHIAAGCQIGANCVLADCKIGPNTTILPNSVIEGSELAGDCQVGPFARLRPGTRLGKACKIGNFVETKKAEFGENSKASHLSYLGDVLVGNHVNIGAGTITCNYDGVHKYQTIIEDGAFIGSDSQLVAPVTVGAHAVLGAGTTLRKNAPPGELTITESKQKTLSGWKRRKK